MEFDWWPTGKAERSRLSPPEKTAPATARFSRDPLIRGHNTVSLPGAALTWSLWDVISLPTPSPPPPLHHPPSWLVRTRVQGLVVSFLNSRDWLCFCCLWKYLLTSDKAATTLRDHGVERAIASPALKSLLWRRCRAESHPWYSFTGWESLSFSLRLMPSLSTHKHYIHIWVRITHTVHSFLLRCVQILHHYLASL